MSEAPPVPGTPRRGWRSENSCPLKKLAALVPRIEAYLLRALFLVAAVRTGLFLLPFRTVKRMTARAAAVPLPMHSAASCAWADLRRRAATFPARPVSRRPWRRRCSWPNPATTRALRSASPKTNSAAFARMPGSSAEKKSCRRGRCLSLRTLGGLGRHRGEDRTMTISSAMRIAVAPDVMFRIVGDESVILHLKSETYLGLDPVGTRMWTAAHRIRIRPKRLRNIACRIRSRRPATSPRPRGFPSQALPARPGPGRLRLSRHFRETA